VTSLGKEETVRSVAQDIYEKLRAAGVDVIWDDRDERPGVKFKDADLIGFPLRIAVGAKSLANGQIEWSWRKDRAKQLGTAEEVVAKVIEEARSAGVSPAG
jgi:prolyl-tRNA synthetase